ncbi:hypothetical protein Tco_0330821 [Tanacetum coccineum]
MQCLQQRHEYVALSSSCAQVMWMRTQHKDYGFNYNKIPLYCDSRVSHTTTDSNLMHPVQHLREQTHPYSALPEDRLSYLSEGLVVRLGINPMIQPEPEDLPKDNPKLEIAVLSDTNVFTMKMEILLEPASNKLLVEEGPNYALMAYSSSNSNSEVSNDSNCLESVEEKHEFYKKNESVYVENINGLKWDIQVGEITISELMKKLEKIQKEKDSIQFNVDKFENASEIPPPYTGNFMPPTPDLSFTGLDEFVNKPVVENRKSNEEVSEIVRKNDDALIIEEWVSDSEEENVSQLKTEKKTVKPSIAKIEFVKPKQQDKTAR